MSGRSLQGIRATREYPNPHLYQSIAILAGEMGYVAEARQWFREGTSALRGKKSHALWHAWAVMEAEKVCIAQPAACTGDTQDHCHIQERMAI